MLRGLSSFDAEDLWRLKTLAIIALLDTRFYEVVTHDGTVG